MVDSGRRPLLTVRKNRNGVAVNDTETTNIVYNFFPNLIIIIKTKREVSMKICKSLQQHLVKEIDTIKAALVKVGFFDDGDRFTKDAEDATSPVYWSYWPDTLPEAVVAELIAGHTMNPSKSACSVSLETIESAAIVLEWEERASTEG